MGNRRYTLIEAAHGKAKETKPGPGHLLKWYERGEDPMFTARELEVALLLADGLVLKEIAAKLDISRDTVARHTATLRFRSNTHTAAGAVAYLFRAGWMW